MAKITKASVTTKARGSSSRLNQPTPLQNAGTLLQNSSKPKKASLAQKGAPPPRIESSALPGLARILRPQAVQRWTMPHIAMITPQYIEMILRAALTGDHVRQWQLFDLMLDSWPELAACSQELTEGVMAQELAFTPFAEEGEAPTDSAIEKQKLVSSALRRMQPDACADENDLEDTLKDILDGWFRGVVCLEIEWFQTRAGKLGQIIAPRATYWAHPEHFAWGQDGRLGLRVDGMSATIPFPPHKFILGIHKAKSGSALGGALLRPLAWWWCAANFSSDWLLNLAQLFGLPFRWANYDPNASQGTVDSICSMLQNMGSAGWAAFPSGTTLELKDTGAASEHSPQGDLLDRADRYARMVILGQTLSGSASSSKGGGKAFGSVEEKVKDARIDAAAKYACKVINSQLIPSIVELNYGTRDESPRIALLADRDTGLTEAQRDIALATLFPLSISQLRQKYGLENPGDEEDSTEDKAQDIATPEPAEPSEPSDPSDPSDDSEPMMTKLSRIASTADNALFAKAMADLAANL